MFAKLIDGNIEVAPHKIFIGGKQIINPKDMQLIEAGYKPLVVDETDIENAEPYYEEQEDKIIQHWREAELDSEV